MYQSFFWRHQDEKKTLHELWRRCAYLGSGDLLDDSLLPLSEIPVHPRVELLSREEMKEIRNDRTSATNGPRTINNCQDGEPKRTEKIISYNTYRTLLWKKFCCSTKGPDTTRDANFEWKSWKWLRCIAWQCLGRVRYHLDGRYVTTWHNLPDNQTTLNKSH